MKLRFISTYTTGSSNKKIAENCLIPNLEKWNLQYHIFEAPDCGSIALNSRQRPLYIKKAMAMFPDENILWLDVDAKILRHPEVLFHIPDACDIGVNYLLWNDHHGQPVNKDQMVMIDCTSYYKNCNSMIQFLDEWITKSIHVGASRKIVLDTMIKQKLQSDLNLFLIPRDYCYLMLQHTGIKQVTQIHNPVIVHSHIPKAVRPSLYDNHGKETGF